MTDNIQTSGNRVVKKKALITLAFSLGLFSFCLNSFVEYKLDSYEVFDQINVLFHSDPSIKLDSFVNGTGRNGTWRIVHPNLANYFHLPIRLLAGTATLIKGGNRAWELDFRRFLALLVAPFFAALNCVVLSILFYRLQFSLLQIFLLTSFSVVSFSQLIFGSMPESFVLNGFFISLCFLQSVVQIQDKKNRWTSWLLLGLFGVGGTITNAVMFLILFFTSDYAMTRRRGISLKNSLYLLTIVIALNACISLSSSLIIGNKPSMDDIIEPVNFTSKFLTFDFLTKSSTFPAALAGTFTPSGVQIIDDPEMEKYRPSWRGKYRQRVEIDYNNKSGRVQNLLVEFFLFTMIATGLVQLFMQGGVYRMLSVPSLAILLYNFLFHSFWGSGFFLYSQHWLGTAIITLSGVFLVKGKFMRGVTVLLSVFLVYIIANNCIELGRILSFLERYPS